MIGPPCLTLANEHLEVTLDPGFGCDVLSLREASTGVDVLFSTPWRDRADLVRINPASSTSDDPLAGYLERYRGGWNTLCPNAGPPRLVHGAPQSFHGEAARATWSVVDVSRTSVTLRVALFSVPVVIERTLRLDGPTVRQSDRLTNASDVDLEIDYVSHPALGGSFLDGRCTVATTARYFTPDPDTARSLGEPTGPRRWPADHLDVVPGPGEPGMAFGWLSDFDGPATATITNHDLGLAVEIGWDAEVLPYAWLWQELSWTEGFPWYRRARAVAVEPASTVTGGPERCSVLALAPRETRAIQVSLRIGTIDRGVETP